MSIMGGLSTGRESAHCLDGRFCTFMQSLRYRAQMCYSLHATWTRQISGRRKNRTFSACQVSALRADFSRPSHAWRSSNLALTAVLSARAVSWAFPHPRSLQRLVGYHDGDHNAL